MRQQCYYCKKRGNRKSMAFQYGIYIHDRCPKDAFNDETIIAAAKEVEAFVKGLRRIAKEHIAFREKTDKLLIHQGQ